ncbi:MAG: AsmA family protein [Pseudomonadota bacterium]|nr:AsmA family protein [Pseudomonadota bacterium]
MIKLLKILAALLLLLMAAAILIPRVVDINDFKDDIKARVMAATGRELTIEGDLRLSVFPWLGVELNGASLADAPGFGEEPFAQIEQAQVRVRLIPLLRSRLVVERVRVQGLRLNLIRDAQGRANWADLIAARTAVPEVSGTAPQFVSVALNPNAPPAAESVGLAHFEIGGLEVTGERITWDDRQAERHLVLDDLKLTTAKIVADKPILFSLRGALEASDLRAQLVAEGELTADGDLRNLSVAPLNLRLNEFRMANGLSADADLQGNLVLDLDSKRYLMDGLEMRIDAAGGPLSGGRLEAAVNVRAELDLASETLKLDGLAVRSGALSVTGEASGKGLLSEPVLSGRLVLDKLDLRAWLTQQGLGVPQTADPTTFQRVAVTGNWRLTDDQFLLQDAALDLDATHVTGVAEVILTSPLGYRFDLDADKLDLDRYLPTEEKPGTKSQAEEHVAGPAALEPSPEHRAEGREAEGLVDEEAVAGQRPGRTEGPAPVPPAGGSLFPVELLDRLDLEGGLDVGELKAAGLALGDTSLQIHSKDGSLKINNRVQRFYEGRVEGRLGLDVRTVEPRIVFVQQATGIQIGPLLKDLTGDDKLTGRGDIDTDLTAIGHTEGALKRSLSGRLKIDFTEGVVKGFNLERMILEARARLKGEQLPAEEPLQTDFTDLHASASLSSGVLSNEDLLATNNHLRVTGKGRVDIGSERFDYRFEPMFVKPPEGRGIKELEDIPVPIRLTGSFDKPLWNVDVASALREIGRRHLEESGGDALKKLEERTGIKGLEQGLRGLFGR